jgi:hypothetical protein
MCLSLGHKLHNFPDAESFLDGEQIVILAGIVIDPHHRPRRGHRSATSVKHTHRQGS